MAAQRLCVQSVLLSFITLTLFSVPVSAFGFGFGRTTPDSNTQKRRVDRIDRESPDNDCYSIVTTDPLDANSDNRANPARPPFIIKSAVVANWASTAQMDAVAFYSTPDCREDSTAMIIRWYVDMNIPQTANLIPAISKGYIPKNIVAYKAIAIPSRRVPAEDVELANTDFRAAVIRNPALMKPGSIYVAPLPNRGIETYCEGLVRYAKFGKTTIPILGDIAEKYFEANPDASQVPEEEDYSNWSGLRVMIDKQVKQLMTGVTAESTTTMHGRQRVYLVGKFLCERLEKVPYIDPRTGAGQIEEEVVEILQQPAVRLSTDQSGASLMDQLLAISRNPISITDSRESGSVPGTSISLTGQGSEQVSRLPRNSGRRRLREQRRGGLESLSNRTRFQTGEQIEQNTENIEPAPGKVRVASGRQGVSVNPSTTSNAPQDGKAENLISQQAADLMLTPLERNLYLGPDQRATQSFKKLRPGDEGILNEFTGNLLKELKQGYRPWLSQPSGEVGTVERGDRDGVSGLALSEGNQAHLPLQFAGLRRPQPQRLDVSQNSEQQQQQQQQQQQDTELQEQLLQGQGRQGQEQVQQTQDQIQTKIEEEPTSDQGVQGIQGVQNSMNANSPQPRSDFLSELDKVYFELTGQWPQPSGK